MGVFSNLFRGGQAKRAKIAFELGRTVDWRQIGKLQPYLNDKSVEVRRAAMSSLEQQWPTGDLFGIMLLTEKLRDPDTKVRATAALAIGEFVPSAQTPEAIEMGSNLTVAVRGMM
jgi:HEAT repeat protein